MSNIEDVAKALCETMRPDRDCDGPRPCESVCALCLSGAKAAVRRVDIKAILEDPELRQELIGGAADFICKVERIRE